MKILKAAAAPHSELRYLPISSSGAQLFVLAAPVPRLQASFVRTTTGRVARHTLKGEHLQHDSPLVSVCCVARHTLKVSISSIIPTGVCLLSVRYPACLHILGTLWHMISHLRQAVWTNALLCFARDLQLPPCAFFFGCSPGTLW